MKLRIRGILILAALVMSGCSEDPTESNSIGGDLTLSGFAVRETTLTPSAASSFFVELPMNGLNNLVGTFEGYAAHAAVQFPSAVLPIRDTIQVLSARLRIRFATRFGDTTGSFGVVPYRILQPWRQDSLTWTLAAAGGFLSSNPVGPPQYFQIDGDTGTVWVSLDTGMVRSWFATGSLTTPDSGKYGVMLLPAAGTSMVRGFSSFFFNFDSLQYYPTLEVIAQNVAGTVRDTTNFQTGADTFVGRIDAFQPQPQSLYVLSGIVYRTRLSFDVSAIPRGSIVTLAQLTLASDLQQTRLSSPPGALGPSAHLILSPTDSLVFAGSGSQGLPGDSTNLTYVIPVTDAVQLWLRSSNYGLMIRTPSAAEFSGFDRYVFASPSAGDISRRPRLRIVYAVDVRRSKP